MAAGLCSAHYHRLYRYGDPEGLPPRVHQYGQTSHVEYQVYAGIKSRCYNTKDKNYTNYGGRGIKICDRWLGPEGFRNFLKDMGKRPGGRRNNGKPYYSIERKDNNGPYSPDNCKWATYKEQSINRRNNIIINYNGKNMTLKDLATLLKLSYTTLYYRYKKGYRGDELLKPIKKYR